MNAVKDFIRDMLDRALNLIYPGVEFDTAGLAGIVTSCLIVLAGAVAIYLLLKCFPDIRRFAHVTVVAALTLLIAASAFFPGALVQAGDYAGDWLEQHYWAQKEEPTEEGENPEGEAAEEGEAPDGEQDESAGRQLTIMK